MTTVHAQLTPALVQAFAPTGSLRASINLGNPILANRDANGQPVGVSVDLATELAKRLGVPLSLVVFDAAGKSVDAVTNEKADFGFFAIDPVRGQGISFTGPYVLIEGSYLVANNSPLTSNDQVDKKGIRIAVGKGSAYDLFLTREIKNAEIHRAPTSPTTVDFFISENACRHGHGGSRPVTLSKSSLVLPTQSSRHRVTGWWHLCCCACRVGW
ncbi:MAG: hypothetical protein EBU20_00655 [Betaproteobacteria bacterium]|nr:hypothetical protein [Betaproteobacteria bacterium]